MDTGDIIAVTISVSSVLVGIFLATAVLVWQMRMQSDRLSNEIRDQNAELKAQGGRISDIELEQARLEGANGTLSEILRQQSHTHESNDND